MVILPPFFCYFHIDITLTLPVLFWGAGGTFIVGYNACNTGTRNRSIRAGDTPLAAFFSLAGNSLVYPLQIKAFLMTKKIVSDAALSPENTVKVGSFITAAGIAGIAYHIWSLCTRSYKDKLLQSLNNQIKTLTITADSYNNYDSDEPRPHPPASLQNKISRLSGIYRKKEDWYTLKGPIIGLAASTVCTMQGIHLIAAGSTAE